jgi:hypothetical protein
MTTLIVGPTDTGSRHAASTLGFRGASDHLVGAPSLTATGETRHADGSVTDTWQDSAGASVTVSGVPGLTLTFDPLASPLLDSSGHAKWSLTLPPVDKTASAPPADFGSPFENAVNAGIDPSVAARVYGRTASNGQATAKAPAGAQLAAFRPGPRRTASADTTWAPGQNVWDNPCLFFDIPNTNNGMLKIYGCDQQSIIYADSNYNWYLSDQAWMTADSTWSCFMCDSAVQMLGESANWIAGNSITAAEPNQPSGTNCNSAGAGISAFGFSINWPIGLPCGYMLNAINQAPTGWGAICNPCDDYASGVTVSVESIDEVYSPSGVNSYSTFTQGAAWDAVQQEQSNNAQWLVNGYSGRCLDADTWTLYENGTKVQLWDCINGNGQAGYTYTPTPDESWRFPPVGQWGTITNGGSNRCLDADTGTIGSNGTKVQLWSCSGGFNQLWLRRSDGSIINGWSGRCLDADLGTIGSDGTKVQLWDCWGGSNQKWNAKTQY